MLPLLLFTSFLSSAAPPYIQFEQTPGGTRKATIEASCSGSQGVYTLSSPVADVVEKSIVRFTQPILSEVAENKCSASCPQGTRLVTMHLANGGMGEVSTALMCISLQSVATKSAPKQARAATGE